MTWRTIDSAPLDGTPVLLFTTCHGQVEAWFSQGSVSEHHESGIEYNGANWICADNAFDIEVEEVPPGVYHHGTATHWMPLHKPPGNNTEVLASFIEYCEAHPDQRFWQALRNWSGYSMIYATNEPPTSKYAKDTFYWDTRRGPPAPKETGKD